MARKRYPPTDPREWLNRARSNLIVRGEDMDRPAEADSRPKGSRPRCRIDSGIGAIIGAAAGTVIANVDSLSRPFMVDQTQTLSYLPLLIWSTFLGITLGGAAGAVVGLFAMLVFGKKRSTC